MKMDSEVISFKTWWLQKTTTTTTKSKHIVWYTHNMGENA